MDIANARTVESTPPETAHTILGFFSLTLILNIDQLFDEDHYFSNFVSIHKYQINNFEEFVYQIQNVLLHNEIELHKYFFSNSCRYFIFSFG